MFFSVGEQIWSSDGLRILFYFSANKYDSKDLSCLKKILIDDKEG